MAGRWRFGRGQTFKEEGDEIAAAMGSGLGEFYLRGQRWAQMIEQEREARRCGEHKARYGSRPESGDPEITAGSIRARLEPR